jgi:sulfur relay (sulfurtransferase) DsrC/TusE family protein
LKYFYHWNITYKEWEQWKEEIYNSNKATYNIELKRASTVEMLRARYKKFGYDPPIEQLKEEVANILTQVEKLKDKQTYIENMTLPITNFSCKEDKYLLWHCPIAEVREYLTKQCGYKERWYYKLFFKH